MVKKAKILATFALVLVLLGGSLRAELITFNITSQVTYVDDPYNLLNGLPVGTMMTGTYTYDSATPDFRPLDEHQGSYRHTTPPYGWYLTADGFVFQTDPGNVDFWVSVTNYDQPPKKDHYVVSSLNNLPFNNDVFYSIGWQLDDSTCTALSSDALPTTPPVLEDWNYKWGIQIIARYNDPPFQTLAFRMESEVTEVVPEPATFMLLALGSLTLLRRKK
jgi:hypothetical protein